MGLAHGRCLARNAEQVIRMPVLPGHFHAWALEACSISAWLPSPSQLFLLK